MWFLARWHSLIPTTQRQVLEKNTQQQTRTNLPTLALDDGDIRRATQSAESPSQYDVRALHPTRYEILARGTGDFVAFYTHTTYIDDKTHPPHGSATTEHSYLNSTPVVQ